MGLSPRYKNTIHIDNEMFDFRQFWHVITGSQLIELKRELSRSHLR